MYRDRKRAYPTAINIGPFLDQAGDGFGAVQNNEVRVKNLEV